MSSTNNENVAGPAEVVHRVSTEQIISTTKQQVKDPEKGIMTVEEDGTNLELVSRALYNRLFSD